MTGLPVTGMVRSPSHNTHNVYYVNYRIGRAVGCDYPHVIRKVREDAPTSYLRRDYESVRFIDTPPVADELMATQRVETAGFSTPST